MLGVSDIGLRGKIPIPSPGHIMCNTRIGKSDALLLALTGKFEQERELAHYRLDFDLLSSDFL